MNSFVNAINTQKTTTTNGMVAFKSTGHAVTDLFFKIGSARSMDIIPTFIAAYVENSDLALRILLWSRDIREGAGERSTFRKIFKYLCNNNIADASKIALKIPELGRWDDFIAAENTHLEMPTLSYIAQQISDNKPSLAYKWMPRKGDFANKLRKYMGVTPKQYRKMLVNGTNVVEQLMCSKKWNQIDYNKVPSVASSRYQKAFTRHDELRYNAWKEGLATGETKVNASVLYPYDVIRSMMNGDADVSEAQWAALPNYVGDSSVLSLVDVSGSMTCSTSKSNSVTCLDVALSLGLYTADKNTGPFKDCFLTFSENPQLMKVKGTLKQKLSQMVTSKWEMSTNLEKAFKLILKTAVDGNATQEDMPKVLLILSDMQFNECTSNSNNTALQMINTQYENAGYQVPKIVFWNLSAGYDNAPAQSKENGVALVSGFSPSIMKSVLSGEEYNPEAVMLKTVMIDRYSV